jgi:hypothetical protein
MDGTISKWTLTTEGENVETGFNWLSILVPRFSLPGTQALTANNPLFISANSCVLLTNISSYRNKD